MTSTPIVCQHVDGVTHGWGHYASRADRLDTALMAPPERDLWMLIGEEPAIADDYTHRTGTMVDSESVELYRLWWDLCEPRTPKPKMRAWRGTGYANTSTPRVGGYAPIRAEVRPGAVQRSAPPFLLGIIPGAQRLPGGDGGKATAEVRRFGLPADLHVKQGRQVVQGPPKRARQSVGVIHPFGVGT